MPDFWMEVEVDKAGVMVVDCGYLNDKKARDRVDALRAFGIGRSNVSIEMSNRLLVKIPKAKQAAVLAKFPIVAGKVYYGTTHHFRELSSTKGATAA
jgi:hypothetical protein